MTTVVDAGTDRVWLRRTAGGDATSVLRTSVRLLVRHWPVLLALAFAGQAARQFLIEGAVRLGHADKVAGLLVSILVPIATMVSLVLMLRAVRTSLPWLSRADSSLAGQARAERWRATLDSVGSVLLPFVTVYASYGYLQADDSAYAYELWHFDPLHSAVIRTGTFLLVTAACAFLLRTTLAHWAWAQRLTWLGVLRAYLEIVWIETFALVFIPLRDGARDWLTERQVWHWGSGAIGRADSLGAPVHNALDWIGGLLGSVNTVLAVPVAWLAIGAVVYGRQITARETVYAPRFVPMSAARGLVRIPRAIRRVLGIARSGLDERFGPLAAALRVLARTGLASMLMFCLLFLAVQTTGVWLFELERLIIGPRSLFAFWMPLSEVLSVVNDAVQMALLACLLAAAADRVLRMQDARSTTARSTTARSTAASATGGQATGARVPAQRTGEPAAAMSAETVITEV